MNASCVEEEPALSFKSAIMVFMRNPNLKTPPAGANPSPLVASTLALAPNGREPHPTQIQNRYSFLVRRWDPSRAPRGLIGQYDCIVHLQTISRMLSIVSAMVGHHAQHKWIGDAGKALLADQYIEAQRTEIVGQRLEDPGALEI